MPWRDRSHTHLSRTPRRLPRAMGWLAVILAGAAGLAGLGFLVGHGAPFGVANVPEGLATAAILDGPAVVIAGLALLVIAWGARRLRYEWLAWRPGPIRVIPFSLDAALVDGAAPPNVDALCVVFRRRLAEMRLSAPTTVPGATPEEDLLGVLGAAAIEAPTMIGSVLAFVRGALPSHAYKIGGVMLRRPGRDRCGVTVHVTELPHRARPPVTVWDSNWEGAMRQAADEATGTMLPGTHLCRDQWSAWRRLTMPRGLMHAYESGATLEQNRRYDEARCAYENAVRTDPMNLHVRLQSGKLEEKLGGYLDAFATYNWISDTRPLRGWARVDAAARRQRRRTVLSARYRRIVLMGSADLTKQWQRTHTPTRPPTRLDHHRHDLREGLVADLTRKLGRVDRSNARVGTIALDVLLGRRVTEQDESDKSVPYLELRELMAMAALDDVPRLRLLARSAPSSTLQRSTVRLTELCIQERLRWVRVQLRDANAPQARPVEPHEVAEQVEAIEPDAGFRTWHENYNAACVFAVPLLDSTLDAGRRAAFAKRAIHYLEQALAAADGPFIATRRAWLVSEDPDLNGLRPQVEFKRFELQHFPATAAAQRPPRVQRLESDRHVRALVVATAERWQQEWRRRGAELNEPTGDATGLHRLRDWWEDEVRAWQLVNDLAIHYRDWNTRVALVREMEAWSERYTFTPLETPYPPYADDPLPGPGGLDASCDAAIRETKVRLDRLADMLRLPLEGAAVPEALQDIDLWQNRLNAIEQTGQDPGRFFLAHVYDSHAALWQILATWFRRAEADTTRAEADADALLVQIGKTRQLWRTKYDWWRTRSVVGALMNGSDGEGVPPLLVTRWRAEAWRRDRRAAHPARG
jgi:hypothetical protein